MIHTDEDSFAARNPLVHDNLSQVKLGNIEWDGGKACR